MRAGRRARARRRRGAGLSIFPRSTHRTSSTTARPFPSKRWRFPCKRRTGRARGAARGRVLICNAWAETPTKRSRANSSSANSWRTPLPTHPAWSKPHGRGPGVTGRFVTVRDSGPGLENGAHVSLPDDPYDERSRGLFLVPRPLHRGFGGAVRGRRCRAAGPASPAAEQKKKKKKEQRTRPVRP